MLGTTHTPGKGSWAILSEHLSNFIGLCSWDTCNIFNFFRSVLLCYFKHLLITRNTGADELFVFPALFNDYVNQTHHKGCISTRTNSYKLICLCGELGSTWINYDNWCIVLFFCMEDMLHRNRMGFCCV